MSIGSFNIIKSVNRIICNVDRLFVILHIYIYVSHAPTWCDRFRIPATVIVVAVETIVIFTTIIATAAITWWNICAQPGSCFSLGAVRIIESITYILGIIVLAFIN